MFSRFASCALLSTLLGVLASAQTTPSVRILLPERTRLLQGQQVDLVLEVRGATQVTGVSVTAGGVDISARFSAPAAAVLDCDGGTGDWVTRANLQSFNTAGTLPIVASVNTNAGTLTDTRNVEIVPFSIPEAGRRNIVLFIGDAMGTTYRDAARLVSRSIVGANGRNSFRGGYFDNLLEMDKMPVTGMSMTYGSDSIVPDSANTGAAWATGNKTFINAVNVFEDGNDCVWRAATNVANINQLTDNPRVENLWQYLKRLYNYRAGIVTTADVTDATPAVQGSYVAFRQTRNVIAQQYFENPMLNGQPAFDVIMGGGRDQFVSAGRRDQRDLLGLATSQLGFRLVSNATELRSTFGGQRTIGLFKGNAVPTVNAAGLAPSDSNMDVAYDKLRFPRPASEPNPNFGVWTDQPMLELMTQKALEILSSDFIGRPFILMVEAASIDKQSHPNQAAGTIWDTIEFDNAIGVARRWASARAQRDTLLVVTADHDQSMHLIGVANVPDSEYLNRSRSVEISYTTPRSTTAQAFTVWGDSYANVRAGLPFINSSTGASNNRGPSGQPATYAATGTVPGTTADSSYATYQGSPAYFLDSASGYPLNTQRGTDIPRRLAVGFRTGDHTASSVPVTAEGPGAWLFIGWFDQSDIFFKMAASLNNPATAAGDTFVNTVLNGSLNVKTFGK